MVEESSVNSNKPKVVKGSLKWFTIANIFTGIQEEFTMFLLCSRLKRPVLKLFTCGQKQMSRNGSVDTVVIIITFIGNDFMR